jgi:uncharacterized membrane protein
MIELLFRFFMYVVIGLSLEIIFSVAGIELAVGAKIERRVPKKYLEGFVSLFMIPIHGLGVLFCFEPLYFLIANLHWGIRYCIWGIAFVAVEAIAGFILDKLFGFYPWDYYELSKFKVAKRGYSLWTLLPLWGLYGLALEVFVKIFVYVSPFIKNVI